MGDGYLKILVTGSRGGIASAFVKTAASVGHEIIALERGDFERLEEVSSAWQNLDGVVFTNGVCPIKPITKLRDEEFAETMRITVTLFLRVMREIVAKKAYSSNGMKAVAISSVSAREGWAGGAAYCASKGALSALARALDEELKTRKIRVVALEPRYVNTPMFQNGAKKMGVKEDAAMGAENFALEIMKELGSGNSQF